MQKDWFDKPILLNTIGKTFKFLSPNTWTTISFVLAVLGFIAVMVQALYLGMVLFILSGLGDWIDGKVARYTGQSSTLGAFWDGLIDRFVDALLIACYFFLELPAPDRIVGILLFVLLFGVLLPPFIVAYANHRGAVPDPNERVIWRFAFRFEYIIPLVVGIYINPVNSQISYILLWVTLVLMVATVIQSTILVFIKARDY